MALTPGAPPTTDTTPGAAGVAVFARLKLRMLGNGFRGQARRIILFLLGVLFGVWLAGTGFLLFVLTAFDDGAVTVLIPAFGGGALMIAWLLVPLLWTGVDETLDPARFALLPIPRWRLVTGLLVAALLGIPAVATLLASTGLVIGAGVHGGPLASMVQLAGILIGVLICVTASRAVTSAFSALLRARRTRDLAAVALALLAALIGPLQLGLMSLTDGMDVDRLVRVAEILGWTPLASTYVIGFDVADGRFGAAAARALIALATLALLLWWWSRTLESSMLGASGAAGAARERRGAAGRNSPVARLYPRFAGWLPRDQAGAIAVREIRYWWRDPRRRATLVTIAVMGVFAPFLINVVGFNPESGQRGIEPSPGIAALWMLSVGAFAAVMLANQFGFDGTAYASHIVAGVPGTVELRARVVGYITLMVPLLAVIAVVFAVVFGRPALIPAMLGGLAAAFGTGIAVNLIISIYAAYSLPETSNPFALNTGAGLAKSLLAFGALFAGLILASPIPIAATLLPGAWSWVVLPAGLGYGIGATLLGIRIGGNALERRGPELLAAVTPSR